MGPVAHVFQGLFPCRFEQITERTFEKGKKTEEYPRTVNKGDKFIVNVVCKHRFYLEAFKSCSKYGRVLFRDGQTIVAAGVVLSVTYGKSENVYIQKCTKGPKKNKVSLTAGRLTKGIQST